ncbi:MAG: hypothetical protein VX444_14645 [Pseudomonadota bacterium]|nr:hypothetical protein [Pseudomonadota bacterium]
MKSSHLTTNPSPPLQDCVENKIGGFWDYFVEIPRNPKGIFSIAKKRANWKNFNLLPPSNGNEDKEHSQKTASAFEIMVPECVRNSPVLVISTCNKNATEITMYLESQNMEVCLTNAVDLALHAIADAPRHWGILFILMDELEDEKSTIDYLRLFRAIQPKLPTVLLSKTFQKNDFGTDQADLCDVSLKLPTSKTSLVIAMSQANQNNRLLDKPG